MGTGAAVAGIAGLAGTIYQAESASSAARTQSRASARAQRTIAGQTELAKSEILDRMIPALADFRQGIQQAQLQIAGGTFNVIETLKQYSGNADQIIANAGVDANKAIMGSAALASGMPYSQFNQTYNTARSATPTARNAMMSNLSSSVGISPQQTSSMGIQPVGQPTSLAQATGQPVATTQAATPLASAAQPMSARTGEVVPSLAGPVGGTGTGFTGAVQDITQGYGTAQRALDVTNAQARGDVTGSTSSALQQLAETRQTALGEYAPYTEAGQAAIAKEAALSGAMGPEAQQAAIDAYIESPGQAYLRQQQEKALLRNQAAIGGLGGGNVRTALQEQAMNIASTQQQQYLENLRSLATRGQEAAGAATGIIGQTGMYGAQLTAGAGNILAQLQQQYGISSANLAQMSSTQLANLAQQTGINIANLNQATAAARAGLQTSLGSGIAQAQASGTSDIAGLTTQGATAGLSAEQNISQTLANLATQTGTNLANLQVGQGGALAAGQYLQGQAISQGLSGLGSAAMYGQYLNAAYPQQTSAATPVSQVPYSQVPYAGYGIGNPNAYTPYSQVPYAGYGMGNPNAYTP